MSKKYAIQWKSTINGRAGQGTRLFEREEAEHLADELNREYPQIRHEIVNTENSVLDSRATRRPPDEAEAQTVDDESYSNSTQPLWFGE